MPHGHWKTLTFIAGLKHDGIIAPYVFDDPINGDLDAKYQQLIAQGKPTNIAITTVMRKLIVIANTLLKADRLWVKSLA